MRKRNLFLVNGLILTFTTLIMRIIGLVFNMYIANKIGSEAIGIFSLLMTIYSFAIILSTSGIGTACTCIVSEEFAKHNYLNGLKAVKTCCIFSILSSIIISIITILFAPIISSTLLKNSISNIPIYCISLGLPLISISSVINGYFSSVEKPYKSAISQILEIFVKIIFTFLLFHRNKDISNIESVCTILILADVISELFSFVLNIGFYIIDTRKYINKRYLPMQMKKRIFFIAFPISITSCIRSGLSSLKQFLIPARLVLSGMTYSLAVSNYGLISRYGNACYFVCKCIYIFF